MDGFDRTICIGDVHGCVVELQELVTILKPRPERDRIFFLGDLVDKGPDSVGAIRWARHYIETLPGSGCILGNHEKTWLRLMKKGALPVAPGEFTDADAAFLAGLPLFIRLPGVLLVHGGIYPAFYKDFGAIKPEDAVLSKGKRGEAVERFAHVRYVDTETGKHIPVVYDKNGSVIPDATKPNQVHWSAAYDGRDGFAVFGHDPRRDVLEGPSAVGIDTGCVFGGKLTAAIFTNQVAGFRPADFEFVYAKRPYADHPLWSGKPEDMTP